MKESSLDYQLIQRRRDLVRSYLNQGLTIGETIQRLERTDESQWFPPSFSYLQKQKLIKADATSILSHNKKLYVTSKEEADLAMVEYLDRQQYLYKEAVATSKWDLASAISKDIARAKGVPVDEVVRIKTDLGQLLMAASSKRRELASPRQSLPSPIEDAVIVPEPSSIVKDPRLAAVQKARRKPEDVTPVPSENAA